MCLLVDLNKLIDIKYLNKDQKKRIKFKKYKMNEKLLLLNSLFGLLIDWWMISLIMFSICLIQLRKAIIHLSYVCLSMIY